MKLVFALSVLILSVQVQAEDIKDFNQSLLNKVQKDIQNDNVEEFKVKPKTSRSPASVEPSGKEEPENKIDKNLKQLGHRNW